MTRFSSAVGLCSIRRTFRGWKLFVLPVKANTTKSARGQTWRFSNHWENGGLLFILGCVTFMVSFPPMCVRWGLPQLFAAFSTPAPSSSHTDSGLWGPQERKPAWWSWVLPPPRERVNLDGKSVFAVNMVCTVCLWDKLWLRAPTRTSASSFSLPHSQLPSRLSPFGITWDKTYQHKAGFCPESHYNSFSKQWFGQTPSKKKNDLSF